MYTFFYLPYSEENMEGTELQWKISIVERSNSLINAIVETNKHHFPQTKWIEWKVC